MPASGTVFSSTVNLIKTILGAGLMSIPYAFHSDGISLALVLIAAAALTSSYGLFLLAKCSKTLLNPRHSSFFTLCSITYPNLSLLFDFAMFIQCFGVGLSYLILIGDFFPSLFGGYRVGWILLSSLVIVPLSSLKHLNSLQYSSFLGLVALVYVSGLVILTYFFGSYPEPKVSWVSIVDGTGALTTFNILIFAFSGSMNLFSIINELKDNSMTNIKKIIDRSIITSTLAFVCVGSCGYLTFGENTLGNVMLNYDPDWIWSKIARFNIGVMVILSFPLLFHPCRIAANNMMHWLQINYGNNPNSQSSTNLGPITLEIEDENDRSILEQELGLHQNGDFVNTYQSLPRATDEDCDVLSDTDIEAVPFSDSRFYGITAILLLIMYVLALKVESFAVVLAVVGATGSTSISFTLPGLFGWKLIGTESLMNGERISNWDKIHRSGSLLLTWFGILVMVGSLYTALFL